MKRPRWYHLLWERLFRSQFCTCTISEWLFLSFVFKLLSEQKHFQTDAVNPGSGVTKSGRRKSVATTRWSLPCSGWATVITVIASMDCPAKLPPALLRNHCRNRSVSLKYSVDTPQHKDFFFFLQPFIQSPLILREKEIIVSIVAYISYIFKYQTQFWCLEALCTLKLALVLQNNCWIILYFYLLCMCCI